jgi:hypothetical protein
VARWHVEKMPERLPSGDVEAVFSLMDDDFTRSMWHFQSVLTQIININSLFTFDYKNNHNIFH